MDRMTDSAANRIRATGSRFRAVTWIVLLAFTLQSFVTQTHIHGVFGGTVGAAAGKTLGKSSPHSNAPARDSSRECQFCQAITHAGVFSAPAAPSLILPFTLIVTEAPSFLGAVIFVISPHPWDSRAPPQS
jgi:hypothetical protein